jgi:hypothetical protein
MTIKAKDPVREAFSDRSTGNTRGEYYWTKGHALNAFDEALVEHGYRFDYNDTQQLHGDEGHKLVGVCDALDDVVGYAMLTWYRMPSGRYEFVAYMA